MQIVIYIDGEHFHAREVDSLPMKPSEIKELAEFYRFQNNKESDFLLEVYDPDGRLILSAEIEVLAMHYCHIKSSNLACKEPS